MPLEARRDSHPTNDLTAVLRRLADALDPDYDVVDTMDLLVDTATRFTPAVDAGIVLADGEGRLHVLGSTSERASDVEEAELGIEQGPCLDSSIDEAFTVLRRHARSAGARLHDVAQQIVDRRLTL
ncbi:ANTAR domain-containing protein [Microbacterium foliorum]|uniref:ANTAR domain-containing protein n=1 Tax=Microbacterium foliorum TaxID=104336 RepID=UPI001D825D1B|nr:ANTAR domain-containing protein [Microbacterium foliorum]CAH0180240.1 hypothetical protein SRABI03_01469 [Microbacterium foliorum]CAH0211243.1 hypothetical protein SRABI44_02175 [Microbacterium foliorum]